MPGESAIVVEGLIVEARPNGTYAVELANGHRLTGFVIRKDKTAMAGAAAGCRVKLRLSPCDLSKGRITGKVN